MSVRNKFLEAAKKGFLLIKRLLTFNITTIVFGALFFYMLVTLLLYATSTHVTSYQVTVGPLTKNPVTTALALRSEQVISAGESGYAVYFAREGMEVRKGGSVYALDAKKNDVKNIELTEEQQAKMRANMAKFSYGFTGNNFYDTYGFKYEIQGNLLQVASAVEQGAIGGVPNASDQTASSDDSVFEEEPVLDGDDTVVSGQAVGETVYLGNNAISTAPEAGVIVYSIDGYESKTPENLEETDFNLKSYKKQELLTGEELKKGDPVYKVISSENWTLLVPLTDKLAATISGRDYIKVKFMKDGESQNGSLSIINVGEQKVAKIELQNGMTRYASDRFLEVELVVNTQSGLKIPISSIVKKEFYKIPRDFLTQGDNGEGNGFIREIKKGDSTEFVSATIYRAVDAQGKEITEETQNESGGYYYIDKDLFRDGDILRKPDSGETFTVGEVDYLEGVYSMNKGYAIFSQIKMLDQNEEYCIVAQGTSYGLQPFDYIVLEGESVKEEDILYR